MRRLSPQFWPRLGVALALAATLAACGNGADSTKEDTSAVQPADPAAAGELKSSTPLGTVSVAAITQALTLPSSRAKGVVPLYAVTSYRLHYLTSDARGAAILASGLVSVPVKAAGAKSPVLSYQHATTMLDAEAPSNNAVASEVAVTLASLGFIVVAPDYVGYGVSKGAPHPYLLAAPSAASVIDFLTAAKTWRSRNGVIDNGQLVLSGYSEGGYVTMAAHRAMQAVSSPHLQQLRIAVPGAGPYDLQATLDGLLRVARDQQPVFGGLITPGLLRFLATNLRGQLRDLLLSQLLGGSTDVVFDARVIDYFLNDDTMGLAQNSSVHDWKPALPVRLFHGRNDQTVPYENSVSALRAMRAQGAGDLVSLNDCTEVPASHTGCVPSFLNFMLGQVAQYVQDL